MHLYFVHAKLLKLFVSTDDSFAGQADGSTEKYAELSIGLVGLLADNLLSHPFIVLRRVCQVSLRQQQGYPTVLCGVAVIY